MIYITGDTHNNKDKDNLSDLNMAYCCMEQKQDFSQITAAIVLGDFGLPWNSNCEIDVDGIDPSSPTDRKLLAWYNKKPFKVLAFMGNHDNYDLIAKLPALKMFGAEVLKVSDNIFYLKRGEVYTIEAKKFLVLGGALSDDKASRVPHQSWWEEEMMSEAEKAACLSKIQEHGCNFDYVLSHTGPTNGIVLADNYFYNEENLKQLHRDTNVLFNDKIDKIITYKKWFFGHWHSDWGYENYSDSKYVPLYRQGIVL